MITAEQVRTQLERILRSSAFQDAERAKAFLTFVVDTTLEGRSGEIKESVIAVEALGRTPTFDPKADPIVRVEAGRLRNRLKTFYDSEGVADPLVIGLPKGSYVPLFSELDHPKDLQGSDERRGWISGVLAGLLVGFLLTAAGTMLLRRKPVASEVLRLSALPPPGATIESSRISPDGKKMAFTALQGNRTMLWVRLLDSSDNRPISGTEGASQAFWSPDSNSLAFFTTDHLLRVSLSGGPPQQICAVTISMGGGSWSRDEVIVFSPRPEGVLYQVPAKGGTPRPATKLDATRGESIHRFPEFLPDGRHFLYVTNSLGMDATALRVGSLALSDSKILLERGGRAVYSPRADGGTGMLLFYFRGALMTQPFDAERLTLSGERMTVAPEVFSKFGHPDFSISNNGTLSYRPGTRKVRQLGWYDREGRLLEALGERNDYYCLRLSPDEKTALFTDEEPDWTTAVWAMDVKQQRVSRAADTRATVFHPVWSADGQEMLFASGNEQRMTIQRQAINGTSATTVLDTPGSKFLTDWSTDGQLVVYFTPWPDFARLRTMVLDMQKGSPRALLESKFSETEASFATLRSGEKYIAYTSDETGRPEVYVRNFPQLDRKWQVSARGGWQPLWRRDGRELFYISGDGTLMAASVRTSPEFQADTPHPLFRTTIPPYPGKPEVPAYSYAPSRNGERFLVNQVATSNPTDSISVVTNWMLQQR